jgi:hypothetical protein
MKIITTILLFTIATATHARAKSAQFSETMLESFKEEVKKDDEAFKKPVLAPSRAPASVPSQYDKPVDKIEKTINQMGSSKW